MEDKILSFIGLARKAGKVAIGEAMCEKSIRNGNACILIVADDASMNTKKKFINACTYRSIPYRFFSSKESVGKAIGKGTIAVICIIDSGFAGKIGQMIEKCSLNSGV